MITKWDEYETSQDWDHLMKEDADRLLGLLAKGAVRVKGRFDYDSGRLMEVRGWKETADGRGKPVTLKLNKRERKLTLGGERVIPGSPNPITGVREQEPAA